jgi:hypothetical protein
MNLFDLVANQPTSGSLCARLYLQGRANELFSRHDRGSRGALGMLQLSDFMRDLLPRAERRDRR